MRVLAMSTVVCTFVGVFSIVGQAGQARSVSAAAAYSAAQATRGKALYGNQCVACHGDMLEGVVGPALTGDDFLIDFGGKSVRDVVERIEKTMPPQAPGTVSHSQAIDLAAYILQSSKYPAGADLTDATMLAATLPPGKAPASAGANAAAASGVPLVVAENLAEFMRGVTFPNANVIFNSQLKNPGEDHPKMPVPYDYVLWGRTAYWGWQSVDEAIAALKETSALFLVPGRRCQNGRAVPVQNADYQKYTRDLMAFADELKKVAQARDGDKLAEMSDQLNNTCANCHKVYRDVTPSGALQNSSTAGGITADRCNPNPTGVGVAQ